MDKLEEVWIVTSENNGKEAVVWARSPDSNGPLIVPGPQGKRILEDYISLPGNLSSPNVVKVVKYVRAVDDEGST